VVSCQPLLAANMGLLGEKERKTHINGERINKKKHQKNPVLLMYDKNHRILQSNG
jgi:hypothetical protein